MVHYVPILIFARKIKILKKMETETKPLTLKDPYLIDLVEKTIKIMGGCYENKDLDGMFSIGEKFGRFLTNYRLKKPENEKEVIMAKSQIDLYKVFHEIESE